MKKILIIIILIATLISCSNDENSPSEIRIRLSNISQFDFRNIVVNTSTRNVNFENINIGEKSEYKTFQIAYRYAFIEMEIGGKIYTLQPIDYFGETPLKNGNYTYQIDANNSQNQYSKLILTLIDE